MILLKNSPLIAVILLGMTGCINSDQCTWHNQFTDTRPAELPVHIDDLVRLAGQPDAIFPFSNFIDENKEVTSYRLFVLGYAESQQADLLKLNAGENKSNEVWVYDENSRFRFPIRGDWRAYIFIVNPIQQEVVSKRATYPGAWIPLDEDYWKAFRP